MDAGVVASIGLVNMLTRPEGAGPAAERLLPAVRSVLAVDPPSLEVLQPGDVAGFVKLARNLRAAFRDLDEANVDGAAGRVNDLLAAYPAQPHLAKEDGRWRMHHHPVDSALVPMWGAICAEAIARLIGAGHAGRFGVCDAPDCEDVYFDESRNGSRRFCSTTCQNRVKAAEFRRRRRGVSV